MDPLTILILLAIAVGGPALYEILKRSPRLVRLAVRFLRGANILFVGPENTGKTSFWNFLIHGQFADTLRPLPTTRPRRLHSFRLKKEGVPTLDVAPTEDIPGDWRPPDLVEVVSRKRPNLIAIFMSLEDDEAQTTQWFTSFCAQLNAFLLEDPAAAKALRALVVVLNKQDLVSNTTVSDRKGSLRAIIQRELAASLRDRVNTIPVVPCTLMKASDGEAAATFLCATMVQALARRKSIVTPYADN